jgi:hypothetical protein
MKYSIVLFKNKERKKIINKFKTFERADIFYKNLIKNNEVLFEKQIENGNECIFEIGLVEKDSDNFDSYYVKDNLGRQVKVDVDDLSYKILKLDSYRVEEMIFDVNQNKRIDFNEFNKKYLSSKGLKMLSKINNKIVFQEDDKTNLFSFKSEKDSERFLNSLSIKFMEINRYDIIIVSDTSKEQKKYLYDLLESKGFDKSILYRRYTTYPKYTI